MTGPILDDRLQKAVDYADTLIPLGHPTRIGIILALREGPKTLAALERDCPWQPANSIQRHTSTLVTAGLLTKSGSARRPIFALANPELIWLIDALRYAARPSKAKAVSVDRTACDTKVVDSIDSQE